MEFSSAIYRGDPCPEFSFSFKYDVTMRVQNIDGAGEVDGCILHLNYQNIL